MLPLKVGGAAQSNCPRMAGIRLADALVNIWNSLSNEVGTVDATNSFENKLDKLWLHQSVKFDFKEELIGTR